ncbi:pre-mRNA-splicing factor RBM22 [Phlyctochytrium arcticum]|nr:pre-mRNA-splicing factor RBM22 [Phlyctochytrium arcticum]
MSRQGWESSDFPILCETCLGPNPYVRMTKQNHGKECKICGRPFTVFRWCPGQQMRNKKTEVCQTCAKVKNVCQTCVLDLEYGLPVQVRDSVLQVQDDIPHSDVNREFFIASVEGKLANDSLLNYAKADGSARDLLRKISRHEPYYKRNKPHICSFYVKGECKRGDECPFRHELPVENDLAHQNIRDRYNGRDDPVARRMLAKQDKRKITSMEDQSVKSLFITGVSAEVQESDLRSYFCIFGEIQSVIVVGKSQCAFVNFASRAAAEAALEKAQQGLEINGKQLKAQWGKSKPVGPKADAKHGPSAKAPAPDMDRLLEKGPPPPPGATPVAYASQDPSQLGTSSRDFRA